MKFLEYKKPALIHYRRWISLYAGETVEDCPFDYDEKDPGEL